MISNMPYVFYGGTWDTKKVFTKNAITKKRIVDLYELECFLEDGGIRYINGECYNISKGDIVLAAPGDICYSKTHFKCLFIRYSFNDEYLTDLLKRMPKFVHCNGSENYEKMFETIIQNSFQTNELSNLESAILILKIIYKIYEKVQNSNSRKTIKDHNLEMAYEYIEQNFTKRISVENVAKHCHISSSHLYKLFSKSIGISPNEYINDKRLALAKRLLVENQMSITQISAECGMNTQSYFCYLFKKKFGITPKQFRNENKY